ncbi:unnamed protein product [Adineta ricciae]|uniref:Tetratricopeptide repeat protein n=1 Tax=Adineta ricciae TaxID=249248 RepID=A0A815MPL3_ADIRI|nr:unnamed protein product [Adineta ricciae]CAF1425831.1 unnamed protein product [Adineta ricciae]
MLTRIAQTDIIEQIGRDLTNKTIHENNATWIHNQLGLFKYQQGQYEGVIILYEKSLEILLESFPSKHPDMVSSYSNIGLIYFEMNDFSTARIAYEQILQIQRQSLLLNNRSALAASYNNFGLVYHRTGDYSAAHLFFKYALQI